MIREELVKELVLANCREDLPQEDHMPPHLLGDLLGDLLREEGSLILGGLATVLPGIVLLSLYPQKDHNLPTLML
tara:strand:+ start:509 stop:733 length:225 start_codon:yes stop_codon:yes gene_type:complete